MADIDSPPLGNSDLEVTFDRPIFTVSKIGKSINQIEIQKSYLRADILYSDRAISISFTQPLAGARRRFELRVSCEPLVLQLSSMALICKSLSGSALLLGVEHLHLTAERPPSSGQDDSERKGWLEIIYPFRSTKWVHVAGGHPTDIALALQLSNSWRESVLPALQKLCIQEPEQHHLPLREAVLSFTHSRRLSGTSIGVEYERLWSDEPRETALSQRTKVELLSDRILLNIFLHCIEASPKFWPTLVHVCQNWRRVVFASPQSLHLRLCCKHGTPVSKTLDCWPALPIVVQYGGSSTLDPPAPEDEVNVLAALKQSDRISSISLTITDSLLKKLFTIEKPFSELEELDLLSPDKVQITLPSIFQWGPRLRRLHLTRIAIPSLQQLSSSTDLVDLQLYEIPSAVYMSPEAFANALSGMTQLRSLSLDFLLSLIPRRVSLTHLDLPPSSKERVVLPALTCLKYRGTSEYLDTLVARIDAPLLGDVDITFFYEPTLHVSRLGRFTEQIDMQLSIADIVSSQNAISIRFTHPDAPTRLGLRISCLQLAWRLSSMAQILDQFSHFLLRVKNLGINTTEPSSAQDDVGGEKWLSLIYAFRRAKDFRVAGEHVTDILCALRPEDGEEPIILPALCNLRVLRKPLSMPGPSWDAVQSLNASRWLTGSPIHVLAAQYSCNLCDASFKEVKVLKIHLKEKHAYRIVCSYCGDFEWSLRLSRILLFQEHLESEHPEVPHIPEHYSLQYACESLTKVKAPEPAPVPTDA